MMPAIFPLVKGYSAITADGVTRFYDATSAPQNPTMPYATWSAEGTPDVYLTDIPDADTWDIQVDVWAASAHSASDTADGIRQRIEGEFPCTLMGSLDRDPTTGEYRYVLRFTGRQSR